MKGSVLHGKSKQNLTLPKNNVKAFFFLRHNNDIDHITPVLYKWLSTENVPTDIIITTKRDLLDDFRINYLKQFGNASIFHINDLFKKNSYSYHLHKFYFKDIGRAEKIFKKSNFFKKSANKHFRKTANKIFKGVNKGIVVFDWTETYFTRQILKVAKERNFTTISLPHGDAPYATIMGTIDELNYDCFKDAYESSNIFDYVVVPNHLCYRRHEKFMEKDRIKLLGSPRYCDEWMNIISEFIPPFKIDDNKDKLKIVFFLRNIGYPIFWEEVVRTIKLIMQFPDVYLIVKHHPRSTNAKKLTKKLLSLYPELKQNLDSNLKFIYEAVNSGSLIKWADIIIDLGTSTTWEPIKLGKPVLMTEYLHANYSTVAYYIKSSEIKCRDQLYDALQKLTKNKNLRFYNEEERRKFIKEIIDVPDKYVLERYCKFLKTCIENSSEGKK